MESKINIAELNYDKLKGRIKEYLGTQAKLAEKLDSDEATVSNKLNNKTYFTQKDIVKICNLLFIDFIDIPKYFFDLKVRKNEQYKINYKKGD